LNGTLTVWLDQIIYLFYLSIKGFNIIVLTYANKTTETIIFDIKFPCSKDEVEDYIINMGKPGFDFPEALSDILHLNGEGELDTLFKMLVVSPDELLNCFFEKCEEDVYYEHRIKHTMYKKIYSNNVSMLMENSLTHEYILFTNELVSQELILFN